MGRVGERHVETDFFFLKKLVVREKWIGKGLKIWEDYLEGPVNRTVLPSRVLTGEMG